jgi:hypothetical protein
MLGLIVLRHKLDGRVYDGDRKSFRLTIQLLYISLTLLVHVKSLPLNPTSNRMHALPLHLSETNSADQESLAWTPWRIYRAKATL